MDSGTSQGTERAARIRLVLDCNEVFKQIAGLQQKLDQLSIKNMNKPQKGTASIADAIKRESIETEQAFNNFKRKVEVKQREIDDVLKKARKTGVSGANNNETNYNYQKALKAMEDNAAGLYRKMLETDNLAKRQVLAKELEKAQQQYQKLNRESANFRKSFGIQSSRGFYDLNSNLDYFFAKFRSRITYMMAENVQSALYNLPKSIFNNLADYQATRTNFAQVMPDHIANNQEEMNKAIQEFIQIGSDYGAVVEEVTDAGRLWGRQYKDVSMVQALVRNSTKLSITDNMKLVEVNKALEATMQQYNIRLKDANEAHAYSNKIVDSWAKLADTAVVTAADLASANERSAGAAYQAGVGFDFLQGMIATMSTATGRAGGEIGNTIRSMLVSMNTAKARKELESLGIAVYELDTKGQKHVRNFENVILDLMQKIKTSEKDMSETIRVMAGGKQRYNSVMALLKNPDELMKNWQTSKNSAGWADEQVELQRVTISRQVESLKADIQQLVRLLDEAGASNAIAGLVQNLRELVQVLQNVNPERLSALGNTIEVILGLKLALFALRGAFQVLPVVIESIKFSLNSVVPVFSAATSGVIKFSNAFKLLSAATGWIGLLVTGIQLAYAVYEGLSKKQNEVTNNTKGFAEQSEKAVKAMQSNVESLKSLNEELKNNQEIVQSSIATAAEKEKADKKIIEVKQKILELLPEEMRQELIYSNFSEEIINKQIINLDNIANAKQKLDLKTAEYQANMTRAVANQTMARIKIYREEMQFLAKQAEILSLMAKENANTSASNVYEQAALAVSDEKDYRADQINQLEKDYQRLEEIAIQAQQTYESMETPSISSNIGISGSAGGISEEGAKAGKGSGGSDSGKNYAERAERLRYQREKNELYHDAKVAATEYETALKQIEQAEKREGITAKNSIAQVDLFKGRIDSLENYKAELEQLQRKLMLDLDNRMANDSRLSDMVGYRTDLTDKEKLKVLEVNRETFQQLKTYTEIVNNIGEMNTKIAETESKISDVNNALENTKQTTNPDELLAQKLREIKNKESILKSNASGYNNPYADLDINGELTALVEEEANKISARLASARAELSEFQDNVNGDKRQKLLETIQELESQQAATSARLRELKLEDTRLLREGLFDVTNQLLIEGNSWKDIWKSLWKGLAKEALAALFKVQVQVGLLGTIMRMFGVGGGSPMPSIASGFKSQYGVQYAHSGEDISPTAPKMHSGGDVAAGRAGVVPTLKNDEVLRTLQVGEEVNSINDRRSNEILAAVAMKAMDSQAKQPTNVNIVALDAKSFAEYLNENSDILMAVLAKNNAMGRRA